jgi:hypothetical protein
MFDKDFLEVLLASRWIDPVRTYNGTPCWNWFGSSSKGYGVVQVNNKQYLVTRVVASILLELDINNSKIFVCHHCDNPSCFNPGHLFLGNHQINCQDKSSKGRHPNQRKTHCPKGHLLDGKNNLGRRYCKTCDRDKARLRYQLRHPNSHPTSRLVQ